MILRFLVFTFALSSFLNLLPYSLAGGGSGSEKCGKPNIVFFLADDLGYADCGFNGGKDIKTPALDRLAKAGVIFDSFYVQPLCSPTRAALLTGRYPMRYGLQVDVIRPDYRYGLSLQERTLSEALREAGYTTAIFGKWHLGSFDRKYWPNARGFDYAYGHLFGALDYFTHIRNGIIDWYRNGKRIKEKGYTTELIAKEVVNYVRKYDSEKPFFLYIPFNAVHTPLQVPQRYLKPYSELKGKRKLLAGMLSALDEAVGRIVEAIKDKGLYSRTLFIFSSDNGGFAPGRVTDNGPLRAGKGSLYEGGVRVCAFATWEGRLPSGKRINEPIHAVDWYPTLIKLAGGVLNSPRQKFPIDGLDIWRTLAEGKPSPHEAILLNCAPSSGAVRKGPWKFKISRRKGSTFIELFNLERDIGEKENLANKYPEKVNELFEIYKRFASQAAAPLSPRAKRNR